MVAHFLSSPQALSLTRKQVRGKIQSYLRNRGREVPEASENVRNKYLKSSKSQVLKLFPTNVDVSRRIPWRLEKKRKARLEKKMKKENKRKKQALAECAFREKRKKEKEERKKKEHMRQHLDKLEVEYWGRVWKSDGFDDSLRLPIFVSRLMRVYKCEKPNDCPVIVRLYAKMGLHQYNMLQGTNFQLRRVEKYNRESTLYGRPCSYYVTSVAEDPATGSLVPFQTSSHERSINVLNIGFYIARPQDTGEKGTICHDRTAPGYFNSSAPEWPSETDKNIFLYIIFTLVQEPELKENEWIRLYLEVGFLTTNRRTPAPELSDLKIVEVMVETKENAQLSNERLKGFKDATFFIKFDQDLGEGQVRNRRAVIRRTVDLRSKRMSLDGDLSI
ncbi:unnamed protein product [Thlaspi arvense]|uniref:Uncharacterized protein n=1 Tax=Thlaspi arvense TaxID=13288 RepID=A0AAU9R8P8_THLAR|nr:unnamed protein product [Thlaspi arvense]